MRTLPGEPAVLAELRDALAQGEALDAEEACPSIARGFVTCNLVMDLADFLGPVLGQSDRLAGGEITYRQVYHAFIDGVPQDLHALIEALPEEEGLLCEYHPWRVVNQWLGLEGLARVVEHRGRSPRQIALGVFEETLAGSVPVEVCCRRGDATRKAFLDWFDGHAEKLAGWLHNLRWELVKREDGRGLPWHGISVGDLRDDLVHRLAQALDAEPIVGLTRSKNTQLETCIGRIRAKVEPRQEPLPGWILRLYNAMKDAQECRADFSLDAGVLQVLQELLAWVRGNGLLELHGARLPLLERLAGTLEQFSIAWAKHPGAVTLAAVMYELKELADVVRRRTLPRDWAKDRHVEDLFSHPLKTDFRFADWHAKALGYGLGQEVMR